MQVKFLQNLVEELAGEGAGLIAHILFNKRDVNEFLIAKKMDLTINQVRNILYKLSNFGLVSFIRKKDNKKGWYIYYWTLNSEKCLVMIESSLEKKIEDLTSNLSSREVDRYYICHTCDIEVDESVALEHGFTCEECADVYELQDNSSFIRDIKARTTRRKKELDEIKVELEELREKEERKRKRAERKLAKEAEAKKALLKKARDAARKKIAEKKGASKEKKTTTKKATTKKTSAKKTSPKKNATTKKTTKKKSPVKKKTTTKKATKKKSPAKKKTTTKKKTTRTKKATKKK